tara:strand:+ start:729 stop:1307 length:579 start_codon:yes stop_codon:yes gene_type:complete
MKNFNKGAMFGVDARVALAVFALLSVLVGASLINFFRVANLQKVIAETKSVAEAVDSFHKDIHVSIFDTLGALTGDAKEIAAFKALTTKADISATYKDRWDGPYLRMKTTNQTEYFLDEQYRLVSLASDLNTTCNDTKANPCYVFLKFNDMSDSICNDFDDIITQKKYNNVQTKAAGYLKCDLYFNLTLDLQ